MYFINILNIKSTEAVYCENISFLIELELKKFNVTIFLSRL